MALHCRFEEQSTVYQDFSIFVTVYGRKSAKDGFDDRFFFEIVQRTGGYQGYGAVNAAVRMAAQARQP
jgi:4-hydroxyphenylpyruvate dioxygenase-like putative hemolysin